MTNIVFGNIIVWPRIPRLTKGVNLARQKHMKPTRAPNVVALPVCAIERFCRNAARTAVIRATMHAQRNDKRNSYALEKLQRYWRNPA